MRGYPTTFLGMFDPAPTGHASIRAIEIPIIQRDYAQGRGDEATSGIRERFLDAVCSAALGRRRLALDFVYGDVTDGILRPLDGQQRLTALFLLHWYVASRAGTLNGSAPWLQFSYATRPTARDFCRAIAEHPLPASATAPSAWVMDQAWYLYPWRHDPTIASMLVMLDAIHERFQLSVPHFDEVWNRLNDDDDRAIWFLLLPVAEMTRQDDLYIKMNSRGKPLTQFEIFKAGFESVLTKVLTPEQSESLQNRLDGAWADLMWRYEDDGGGDLLIDDEFMRYLTFIMDICEWRDGQPDRRWWDRSTQRMHTFEERARLSLADESNPHALRNREFFFHAFETWVGVNPGDEFRRLFRTETEGAGDLPLLASKSADLFGACIAGYGAGFSYAETLMLFAVLLARQSGGTIADEKISRRLRTLRNLAESAFLDSKRMSEYVATTERLMLEGSLDRALAFHTEWAVDEKLKWRLLDAHPELAAPLHRLEDHITIRGRLFALDLDDIEALPRRSETLEALLDPALRDLFGAALLTKADYSRDMGWDGSRRQLGNSQRDDSWRDLFTAGSRALVQRVRDPLMSLLDDIHSRGEQALREALSAIATEWCAGRHSRQQYDWRYYLVRYPGARSTVGEGFFTGTYDPAYGGFRYEDLRILHGSNYTAYCSDALLMAAWVEGNLANAAQKPSWWRGPNPGLRLRGSNVEVHSLEQGLALHVPEDSPLDADAEMILRNEFPDGDGRFRPIAQRDGVDAEDRVQLVMHTVRKLAAAGL